RRAVRRRHRLRRGFARVLDLQPAERHAGPPAGRRRAIELLPGSGADRFPGGVEQHESLAVRPAVRAALMHLEKGLQKAVCRPELNYGAEPAHSSLRRTAPNRSRSQVISHCQFTYTSSCTMLFQKMFRDSSTMMWKNTASGTSRRRA